VEKKPKKPKSGKAKVQLRDLKVKGAGKVMGGGAAKSGYDLKETRKK
jgi:hypothetical protein